MKKSATPTVSWTCKLLFAFGLGSACLITYYLATEILLGHGTRRDSYLGGMWACVATVFVFRNSVTDTLLAVRSRLVATAVSSTLCFAFLFFFPFSPLGLAVLIALGTVTLYALGEPQDIGVAGITTSVVMVTAAQSTTMPWLEPGLRMIDTLIGMFVGAVVSCLVYGKFFRGHGLISRLSKAI